MQAGRRLWAGRECDVDVHGLGCRECGGSRGRALCLLPSVLSAPSLLEPLQPTSNLSALGQMSQ